MISKRQPPAAVFALLPLLWLWYVLLNDLHVEWTVNPQYGYGWAVPFLCLFLIARKISRTPAPHPAPQLPPTPGSLSSLPTDRSQSFLNFSFQLSQFLLCFKRGQHRTSTPPTAHCQLPTANLLFAFTLLAFLYAPTRLIQQANPGWRLVSWGLAIEVVGLTLCILLLAGDVSVRRFKIPLSAFYFPLLFFLVSVPWPTVIESPLIQALTRLDVVAACEAVGWFGSPVVPHGNIIELSIGQVGVDDACSGIRSFQATLMISLFLGEFYGLGWRRRLLCASVGFFLALLLNLLRQVILIVVAARHGVTAIANWHDPAGVVILFGCFFALWIIGKWLARKISIPNLPGKLPDLQSISQPSSSLFSGECQPPANSNFCFQLSQFLLCFKRGHHSESTQTLPSLPTINCPPPNADFPSRPPTANCPLSTLVIPLSAWLLFVEVGVLAWYSWRDSTQVVNPTWRVDWPAGHQPIPIPETTSHLLRFDYGQHVTWGGDDGRRVEAYYLRWNPGLVAGFLAKLHTPQVCLPAAGFKLVSGPERMLLSSGSISFPFQRYEMKAQDHRVDVFYCDLPDRGDSGSRQIGVSSWADRFQNIWDGSGNCGQRVIEIALWDYPATGLAQAVLLRLLPQLIHRE